MINKSLAKRLENELDFDFRAEMTKIETLEDFDKYLMTPFMSGKQIYYRGERKSSITRPLLPTIYRDKEWLFDDSKKVALINSKELYSIYDRSTRFFSMYEKIIGKVRCEEMYSFLAFSQHYFGVSPLIDFSKSLYVALSFALKDRTHYTQDVLIYTLELKSKDDYTNSIEVANKWIDDYSVLLFRDFNKIEFERHRDSHFDNPLESIAEFKQIADKFRGHSFLEMNAPTAKLIDVPSNDLLRYQQGVFLLLDDFSLMGKSYLTKKIRDDFNIKKWLINKDICPRLFEMLVNEQPYYQYKYITNLSLVADVIKNKTGF